MTSASLGAEAARSPLRDRRDDLYETPPVAVRALSTVESLPHSIWEPACGRGAISRTLTAAGHRVVSSDLVDYGFSGQESGADFLMTWRAPDGVEAIVTNPPYKLAEEFVRQARWLCPLVIMLLRLQFYESMRRSDILEAGDLARIWVFRKRLPQMHRDGWTGPKKGQRMAFAWFVWDRSHNGPTTIGRL